MSALKCPVDKVALELIAGIKESRLLCPVCGLGIMELAAGANRDQLEDRIEEERRKRDGG